MTTFTTKTVSLKAANGNHIRKVTTVKADWGTGFCVVSFMDQMPKRQAIEQAKAMLLRDGTLSPWNV